MEWMNKNYFLMRFLKMNNYFIHFLIFTFIFILSIKKKQYKEYLNIKRRLVENSENDIIDH